MPDAIKLDIKLDQDLSISTFDQFDEELVKIAQVKSIREWLKILNFD